MSDMTNRKVELYRVEILNKENKPYTEYIILQDLLQDFFCNYSIYSMSNGYTVNSNKKYWVDLARKNYIGNHEILEVKLIYSKFNKKLNLINVNDRSVVGDKGLNEGDEEKQHFTIKFYTNHNYALIVFEKVLDSIPMTSIKKEINNYLKRCFIDSEEYKYRIKKRDIKFNINPIVSINFVENVANLKGVKLLKTIVNKDYIDEDLRFSTNLARPEAELIVKSKNRHLIGQNEAVTYCNKFIKGGKIKDKRISRIVIEGINDNNSRIKLDTDGMKLCENLSVELDLNNTIDTEKIFDKFRNLILNKIDDLEKSFNITLNNELDEE